MDKEIKTVNINIRVSESTKNALQKLADNDKRTLSDYIRIQLENLVTSHKKR